MKKSQHLPDGVRVCPEAAAYLQRAIDALEGSLIVNAWNWAEKARAELD